MPMGVRLALRCRNSSLVFRRVPQISSRLFSTHSRQCPSCSSPLPTSLPTCPNCFHIEPVPASQSYFDLFGLSSGSNVFIVNARDLRTRFLHAQRLCHPDAWSGKGKKEQAIAASQSAMLNNAYRTLLSPVLRAQYILEQHGFPHSETDKLEDKDLIMEVMETREALDEASSFNDAVSVRKSNNARVEETTARLERLISREEWEAARYTVTELKYLEGIETAAKEKMESFA